ncbi:MAG: TlpA family protein disulfide reductase [Egibacteraceae bacterium]
MAVVAAVLVGLAVPTLLTASRRPPEEDSAGWRTSAPSLDLTPTAQRPLPEVTLTGFGGGPDVALASYRGRPLVLNLWATWCAPCVEEMPAFQQVASSAEGTVAFLGVDVMDTPSRAEPFVEKLGITYDLAIDPTREFAISIGAVGMPTTLLVNADGTIVYRHRGPLESDELRRLITEHLAVQV